MKRSTAGNRLQNDTVKVPAEKTGLNAAIYVHVDRRMDGEIADVRISHPGKFDDTTMGRTFEAINEAIRKALVGATD